MGEHHRSDNSGANLKVALGAQWLAITYWGTLVTIVVICKGNMGNRVMSAALQIF